MLNTMRIRTMLTLGYGVVIFFMALIVGVTHLRVNGIAGSIDEIHRDVYPNTMAAAAIRANVVMNWANTLTLGTIGNKEVAKRIEEEMAANSKVISDNFEFLKREFRTEDGRKLVDAAVAARAEYTRQIAEYIEMTKEEDKDPARFFLIGPLRSSLEAYLGSIGNISAALNARLERESTGALSAAEKTRTMNLVIGLIALAVAVVSATITVRTVFRQLGGEVQEASDIAREIAAGNLAVAITARNAGASSLLASLASMRDKLRAMAVEIQGSAQQVTETARNVSQAAAEVAQASASQSAATGAAAAAVEELTVGIEHLSRNADDAGAFTRQASDLSQNGATVIRGAGTEMQKISQSVQSSSGIIAELEQRSNEISAVVNVIKEIADQTNLLALNAAIEAARAGEQGRGFAVVADEVRKLAERTSSSTREIATTIAEIQQGTQAAVQSMVSGVDQVKSGTRMAELAGESIAEIQSGSARVVEAVNDISSALKEQSAASNEISRSIEQIVRMVSSNQAAAEHVAAAATAMEEVADGLSNSVKFFRL